MTRADDLSRAMHLRYAAPRPAEPDGGELDLAGLARMLRRRIWLIVALVALASAAALPPILAHKPVFAAASRVLIHPPSSAALTGTDRLDPEPLNLQTEVERLLSREAAVQVIQRLGLADRVEFNPALGSPSLADELRSAVSSALGGLTGEASAPGADEEASAGRDPLDPVVRSFFDALRISRDPSSNVIEIGFSSHDPALGAAVPNMLLRVYLEAREADRVRRLAAADNWLSDRIEAQRRRVAEAERAVSDFAAAGGLASSELLAGSVRTIGDLNAQRAGMERARRDLSETSAALRRPIAPEDRIVLVDTPVAADLGRQLQMQRGELQRLLEVYGGASPQVLAAQGAIRTTTAAIEIETARAAKAIDARLAGMARDEVQMRAGLASAGAALQDQSAAAARRRELEAAAASELGALAALEDRRRALAAERALPSAEVEVLSPATTPLRPSGRGRAFLLVLVLAGAGFAALTAATLAEVMDRSVRSPSQLRHVFDVLPAGLVHRLPRRVARDLPRFLARHRDGALADAIRGVLAGVKRANGGRLPDSLLVTSPLPGEGKTALAAALAAELAASRPVLLVDCDPMRGRVHDLFGTAAGPGLVDVIEGRIDVAEAVRTDETSGIAFLTRGSSPGRPLDAAALEAVLAYAKEHKQVAILDASPVLATLTPALLVEAVEAVVLVLRWGKTELRCAEAAIERLRDGDPRPVALVMNRVDPGRHALYGFNDPIGWSARFRTYAAGP